MGCRGFSSFLFWVDFYFLVMLISVSMFFCSDMHAGGVFSVRDCCEGSVYVLESLKCGIRLDGSM